MPYLRLQPHRQRQRRLSRVRYAEGGGGESMRWWALNLAAAFCLVLCIGTAALWVRSISRFDSFGWHDAPDSGFQVSSATGGFFVVRLTRLSPD